MKYSTATLTLLVLFARFSQPLLADTSSEFLSAAFKSHCIKCHGKGGTVEGEVDLQKLTSADEFQAAPELLETLIEVLRDRRMPPDDEPALPADVRERMVHRLQHSFAQVLKTLPFEPVPIRRMNRFQYNNAVVDLLELDRDIFQLNERLLRRREDYFRPETRKMPDQVRVSCRPLSKDIDNQRPEGFRGVAAFPQDKRAEHGFDNRADHLTLSPLLMESFLKLSRTIAESPDLNPRECRSWDRLFAPPGEPARSGVAGRYEAELEGPVEIVGRTPGRPAPQNMQGFGSDWSGNAQLFWRCPNRGPEMTLSFDVAEPGTGLRFGFTKARDYGTFEIRLDGRKIGAAVDFYNPQVTHVRHSVAAKIDPGVHTLRFKCVGKNKQSTAHFFGLDYIDVTGRKTPPPGAGELPNNDIARDADLRNRLAKLLRRAFRRPVDPETLERFATFAERQLAAGTAYDEMMRTVVAAVLGMPDFLYLYETIGDSPGETNEPATATKQPVGDQPGRQPPGPPNRRPPNRRPPNRQPPHRQPIDDFELAERLAQFFWSSIPDDTLLDLAESGKLSDPDVLSDQIDRLMNDRRSSRFCDNFPAQWLQLDRLITAIPDPKKFPYFYYRGYRTSMHMMSEPLLLFETVYVEDRSIVDLIAPRFTWQSDMLGQNYRGQSDRGHDVQVQVFKRVPLADPRRGGVITSAAVLTMTSTPTRTQPITRGAWVNSVIFNDPPEPPPADVPALPEVDREALAKLTIRERLAVHRKRADCAGCHNKIDPLGFALENYGPTGIWRDKYENNREVDASGELFNQHRFETIAEFKRILVQHKQRFIRGFVAHLLSYALGRELGPADSPALDAMTSQAISQGDQLRAVLKRVAMSEPFLHKK